MDIKGATVDQISSGRRGTAVGWLVAIVMLCLAWRGAHKHATFLNTDLAAWRSDWQGLIGCLARSGDTVPCFGPVSKFPLAYLANSLMFRSTLEHGQWLLTLVNGLALMMPMVALWFSQGVGVVARAGWPYLLALALSPLPMFYVASGALEVQAGVVLGIYMGSFARVLASPGFDAGKRTAWIVAASGFVFPLYKDAAAALVGIAAAVTLAWNINSLRGLASTPAGRVKLWRGALLVAGPVLAGQLFNAGYCWFKYGVPLPLAYMTEAAEAGPSYARSAEFLVGSLLSPNGGILISWCTPLFVAIAGWRIACVVPQRTVVVLTGTTAVVFWVALSRWWTPFGWDGWGDRLMIPAMLAVLAALPFGMRPRHLTTEPTLTWPIGLACAPLVFVSFYYVVLPYSQSQARSLRDSLHPGPHCRRMSELLAVAQPSTFWRSDVYYTCARERMLYIPRRHVRTR